MRNFPLLHIYIRKVSRYFAKVTRLFALFRESFALIRESFALFRESYAFIRLIRESYAFIRESFALIREKYNFFLNENEHNSLSYLCIFVVISCLFFFLLISLKYLKFLVFSGLCRNCNLFSFVNVFKCT